MHEQDQDIALPLEQLVRAVRRLASAGELSLPAAAVLARLDRDGPQRLTVLARSEGLSQPGTTQLVNRLVREGFARRSSSPEDGRVVLVEVTPLGRELVVRRRVERAEALHRLLDRLDAADRDLVLAAMPAIGRLADLALTPQEASIAGAPA
jgi:DNA-binding MarR family transcriptional regulator